MHAQLSDTESFGCARNAPTYHELFGDEQVVRKTIAGHREFEQRRMPLRAQLRRLLILIDGKRTTHSLANCVRANELFTLLEELRVLGLVEPNSVPATFVHASVNDEPEVLLGVSESRFEAVKQAGLAAAEELLGSISRPYCQALLLCRDRTRMRDVFDEIDAKIRSMLGDDAGTVFFEILRDAARVPEQGHGVQELGVVH
jgi:hypothetical protein